MIPTERLKEALRLIVEAIVGPRVDYLALYSCAVVLQNPITGRLDLLPDDDRIRGFGLQGVPIKLMAPGFLAGIAPGTRVLLGFEAGDPTRPYAALWETAATLTPPVPPVTPGQVAYSHSTLDATFNLLADYVARANDTIIAGHLAQDTAAPFTVWYAPDVNGVAGTYAAVAINPNSGMGPPAAGFAGTLLLGRVTSGNPNLRA